LRIAIISDIHANIEALTSVLDHISSQKVQDIVCLGDVIGYGPNPRDCIKIVKNARFCLMGNHEEAVMFYGEDFNEKARQALEWTKEQLNSPQFDRSENYEMWNFLGGLEETRTEGDVYFVHGSPRVPTKEYMVPTDIRNREKMTEIFSMIPSLCFVGHSHIPGVYTDSFQFLSPDRLGGTYTHQGGKALVNVGSVGQPRDGDRRASYALFNGEVVEFRRVEYDVEAAAKDILATRALPPVLAQRLIEGW